MIQFFLNFDKSLTQNNYDKFLDSLNFASLECSSCTCSGNCTRHAFYVRNIITEVGKIPLKILRVKCGRCKTTHAILPEGIVPYSQILLEDQIEIITQYEEGVPPHRIVVSNPEIDTWIVVYVIKGYLNHWLMRLLSGSISLALEIRELICSCFKHHDRQFMQIKCTPNSLFVPTT